MDYTSKSCSNKHGRPNDIVVAKAGRPLATNDIINM